MKLPLHISFHGLDASPTLEAAVRERADRLETFSADIVSCRVAISLSDRHKQNGRNFRVRIDLTVPGHELVANRAEDEDPYVAVREAFDDVRRQLEDTVRRRRGQVKDHPPLQP